MQNIPHVPVLYREVVDAFSSVETGIVIDCTMGYGGHSSLILESNPNIKLIAIDQDQTAIDFSTKRLQPFQDRVEIRKGRFSSVIKEILQEYDNINIKGILADIGVSSLQLDQKERGFSFESDNLDMRMDKESGLSASEVVNEYSRDELERVLFEYGELRNYKKIASVIISNRPFHSAKELSEAVKPHMPHGKKIHPATLLMQAIRIEVNDELGELKSLLASIENAKLQDTKVAIISFHSLEDRIVKQEFSRWAKSCICPPEAMRCVCGNNHALGKIISKKPITAQDDELKENARSRSAKMRLFQTDIR
ncbi:MAG: 16S rRNA (cytosine(1402)-N(4))-methyltransferase RsmH [Sulfurimonas sp.]|nr:16S rRNA (cytosine(1402)-N(4))-methyltransferase RsmH [Sulfurimonas sp.]MBU3937949.1 16S rRNA (cytosine(1402)-N(4))-methyltransferase RsmH [bacterium]MBU4023971.1 16S rRNA (cytosine(1402)-N(4))-methyltransferase RsmH [bacterium]MBU4057914.1 16S rRNA (cytosine(1402)-N(4))-methyltransferase RsmH [bacterium]MBU4109643.1 16S rRNA (cytosine(1402)-N(4))-methyltransferase RsmH [bacterium]